jgi:heme/copper-type cytochrome/quinol oxidase subunit 2
MRKTLILSLLTGALFVAAPWLAGADWLMIAMTFISAAILSAAVMFSLRVLTNRRKAAYRPQHNHRTRIGI